MAADAEECVMVTEYETAAKYLVWAEELRAIAIRTAEGRGRDALLLAAQAYEQMASPLSQKQPDHAEAAS